MTLRTRVAIVVVVVFMGWVFASPNGSSSKKESLREKLAPTLQIRAASPADQIPPPAMSNGWAEEEFAARPQPPRSLTSLAPMPISAADVQPEPRLQPVRLLGPEFAEPPDRSRAVHQASSNAACKTPVANAEVVEIPPAVTQWHRIINGDSLESIAKTCLGDSRQALSIYNANRDLLDSPEFLPIGLELRIPRRKEPPVTSPEPTPEPPPSDAPKALVPALVRPVPRVLEEISTIPDRQGLTPIPSSRDRPPLADREGLSPIPDSIGWRRAPERQPRLDGL